MRHHDKFKFLLLRYTFICDDSINNNVKQRGNNEKKTKFRK